MAAMLANTFAGLAMRRTAAPPTRSAAPAKMSRAHVAGSSSSSSATVRMAVSHRAQRLVVRAADDAASPDAAAPAESADFGDDDEEDAAPVRSRGRGGGARGGGRGRGGRGRGKDDGDGLEETVVQVQRVTKVTKGGNNMSFRATVVVGDGKGKVGVGCSKAREVQVAVTKAAADARKCLVDVPLAKGQSFPHRVTVKGSGGAVVMLRPAGPGTGVIAGGSCRTVLELAGYKNCFAKQLGSPNPLNNARAVVKGLAMMRTYKQVAKDRDITVEELFSA